MRLEKTSPKADATAEIRKSTDRLNESWPTWTGTNHLITGANIERESYYNLSRLATLTTFANPIAAIKELGGELTVAKDECGNILSVIGVRYTNNPPRKTDDASPLAYDCGNRGDEAFQ